MEGQTTLESLMRVSPPLEPQEIHIPADKSPLKVLQETQDNEAGCSPVMVLRDSDSVPYQNAKDFR